MRSSLFLIYMYSSRWSNIFQLATLTIKLTINSQQKTSVTGSKRFVTVRYLSRFNRQNVAKWFWGMRAVLILDCLLNIFEHSPYNKYFINHITLPIRPPPHYLTHAPKFSHPYPYPSPLKSLVNTHHSSAALTNINKEKLTLSFFSLYILFKLFLLVYSAFKPLINTCYICPSNKLFQTGTLRVRLTEITSRNFTSCLPNF